MTTLLTPPPAAATLTAADLCDRCGARAWVRAILVGGTDLVFCAHHARRYEQQLRKVAVRIIDESHHVESMPPD